MSKELKDDFLNIIEGMDLIDEYGNGGSQLAKEKLGPDGRPCLNLTVYMVALGKREERRATLAAGTARLKHPEHKTAEETLKEQQDLKKSQIAEAKVLAAMEQKTLITAAVQKELNKGSGAGAKDKKAATQADDSSEMCKYDTRCFKHREGTCTKQHTGPPVPQNDCKGWNNLTSKTGLCLNGLNGNICNEAHPPRTDGIRFRQFSPTYKGGKVKGDHNTEIITYEICSSCTSANGDELKQGELWESGTLRPFRAVLPNSSLSTYSMYPTPTYLSPMILDLTQVRLATDEEEDVFECIAKVNMIYQIPEKSANIREIPVDHPINSGNFRSSILNKDDNNSLAEGATLCESLTSVFDKPVSPDLFGPLRTNSPDMYIMTEDHAGTNHTILNMEPNKHPGYVVWDGASSLHAAGNLAILDQSSLVKLLHEIRIKGATGTTVANIAGRPHNQREALSNLTVFLPTLGEHILSLGRATQVNEDGNLSIFLLNAFEGYHILLSDSHIRGLVRDFQLAIQPYIIGTAVQEGFLWREELQPHNRESAERQYHENLTKGASSINITVDQPVTSPTNLDAGLSMLANTRLARADASSA
jgi:hypothetical protein